MSASAYIAIGFIIFIILVTIFISWFNSYKKKRERRKQFQKFNEFVLKNNLTIDNKQRFNKNIIGIDRLNFIVIFLNNRTQKFHLIRLKELAECRLVKERIKPGGDITRIFLQFIFKKKEREDIMLPFYNELNDGVYMMMRFSKRAAYWAKRINIFRETAILKDRKILSA